MSLDAQTQAFLDEQRAGGVQPWHVLSLEEARQALFAFAAVGGEPEPVSRIEDREIPGPGGKIRIRIYRPEGQEPFPALVYFHGGGWVLGCIETHDAVCAKLARAAACVVVSVEYRLAPEYPFPAAPEDCYAATKWVAEHATTIGCDLTRIAVGGESAGGNLAAVVSLMARDRGGPSLVYQLLVYPATDYYLPGTPSYQEYAVGYSLTRDDMIWFWHQYLSAEAEKENPYIFPLQAANLQGVPPAFVITAECDPLRDEGERYAQRLQQAGVPVIMTRYSGTIHGFFNLANILDQGDKAHMAAAVALRAIFAPATSTTL